MALVKFSYFFGFITLSSFLAFSVHSASESSAPPIFSPDEISTPKSALKAVSKILEARIQYNTQLRTFIGLEEIPSFIRKQVIVSLLAPNNSQNWESADLGKVTEYITIDLNALQEAKNLTDTLYPLHHSHPSILWLYAFQALAKEKCLARERINVGALGETNSEYDTFLDIRNILEPFLTPAMQSEVKDLEQGAKKGRAKEGSVSQAPLNFCAMDLFDAASHLSDYRGFITWGIDIGDRIERKNPNDPSLDKIHTDLDLFARFYKSLTNSKEETPKTLMFKLRALLKIEQNLILLENLVKEGETPPSKALETKVVLQSPERPLSSEEHLQTVTNAPILPVNLAKEPVIQPLPQTSPNKGKGKAADQTLPTDEDEGMEASFSSIDLSEETVMSSSATSSIFKKVPEAIKAVETIQEAKTENKFHQKVQEVVQEIKESQALKFREATGLLQTINIKISSHLVSDDKKKKGSPKKNNGNLCIRVPHKETPGEYSLRFFHPPHPSEDNIGKQAFWRKAILASFQEAGWID